MVRAWKVCTILRNKSTTPDIRLDDESIGLSIGLWASGASCGCGQDRREADRRQAGLLAGRLVELYVSCRRQVLPADTHALTRYDGPAAAVDARQRATLVNDFLASSHSTWLEEILSSSLQLGTSLFGSHSLPSSHLVGPPPRLGCVIF